MSLEEKNDAENDCVIKFSYTLLRALENRLSSVNVTYEAIKDMKENLNL